MLLRFFSEFNKINLGLFSIQLLTFLQLSDETLLILALDGYR